jgi:large subunit ribosomal protein L10
MKDNKKIEIKKLLINRKIIKNNRIKEIAKLPTKKEAIAIIHSKLSNIVNKLIITTKEIPLKNIKIIKSIIIKKK